MTELANNPYSTVFKEAMVVALNDNTLDIDIDGTIYTNVDIHYHCDSDGTVHGNPFQLNDTVVVSWDKTVEQPYEVIGYKDFPRDCLRIITETDDGVVEEWDLAETFTVIPEFTGNFQRCLARAFTVDFGFFNSNKCDWELNSSRATAPYPDPSWDSTCGDHSDIQRISPYEAPAFYSCPVNPYGYEWYYTYPDPRCSCDLPETCEVFPIVPQIDDEYNCCSPLSYCSQGYYCISNYTEGIGPGNYLRNAFYVEMPDLLFFREDSERKCCNSELVECTTLTDPTCEWWICDDYKMVVNAYSNSISKGWFTWPDADEFYYRNDWYSRGGMNLEEIPPYIYGYQIPAVYVNNGTKKFIAGLYRTCAYEKHYNRIREIYADPCNSCDPSSDTETITVVHSYTEDIRIVIDNTSYVFLEESAISDDVNFKPLIVVKDIKYAGFSGDESILFVVFKLEINGEDILLALLGIKDDDTGLYNINRSTTYEARYNSREITRISIT